MPGPHRHLTRMRSRNGVLLSRVAENAGSLFSATLSIILVVALIALVFAFVRELRRDSVLLETFAASKDLVERGYTSTVIAEKLLDEIRAIDRGSPSVKRAGRWSTATRCPTSRSPTAACR